MSYSGGRIISGGAVMLLAALVLGSCSTSDGPAAPRSMPVQPSMGFLSGPPAWQTTPRTAEQEMLEVCFDWSGPGASASSTADFAVAGTLTSGAAASSNGDVTLGNGECKEVFFSGYGENWLVEVAGEVAVSIPTTLTFDDVSPCSAFGTPLSTYQGMISLAGHVVCMGAPRYYNAAFSAPNYLAFTTHPEMDHLGITFISEVSLTSFYLSGFGQYRVKLYSNGSVVYTASYNVFSSRTLIRPAYTGPVDEMRISVNYGSSTIGIDNITFIPIPVNSARITLWTDGATTSSDVNATSVGSLTIGRRQGALVEFFRGFP